MAMVMTMGIVGCGNKTPEPPEEAGDRTVIYYAASYVTAEVQAAYKELIEVAVSKARVPLKAVLGSSVISLNDFINMQKGDIIKLNTKVDDELDVYVGNIIKFTALPGTSSEAYAVKVSSIIREEEPV